jgi:menaquinone-dependent protoporphyrinogen oxidase
MPDKVLVTYASRTGTTTGVAQAIGKILERDGIEVDVVAMEDVHDLAPYRAVVLGSSIQAARWLPEATAFVHSYQATLRALPVAIFTVCMTMAMARSEQYRQEVAGWLAPVRSLIRPVNEGYFAGRLQIDQVSSFGERIKFRFSVLFGIWKEGDHRDWRAIALWAGELKKQLAGR